MKQKQAAVFDFHRRFQTENDCIEALAKLKWPKGFKCPRCGHSKSYSLDDRREVECAKCKHQTSVTAGTLFHKTRTPLLKWFYAIVLISTDKGGVSALRLSKQLGLRYATAWLILHKLRKAMADRDAGRTLCGVVEVDDAYFGGRRKGKQGSRKDKVPVIVMVESDEGHCGYLSMVVVEHADLDNAERVIEKGLEPNQFVRTDNSKIYNSVSKIGHGHKNTPVTPDIADEELPCVNKAISLAKRFMLGTHHMLRPAHLQLFLNEFCYRFNRRHSEPKIFEKLLHLCVSTSPILLPDLRG